MSTRLIIAGGRDWPKNEDERKNSRVFLFEVWKELGTIEVVSGCCKGADEMGEQWANDYRIPLHLYPADWEKHGRAAGPIRNRKMAEYADAVALLPGGKGTENMKQEALKHGLQIFEYPDGRHRTQRGG